MPPTSHSDQPQDKATAKMMLLTLLTALIALLQALLHKPFRR